MPRSCVRRSAAPSPPSSLFLRLLFALGHILVVGIGLRSGSRLHPWDQSLPLPRPRDPVITSLDNLRILQVARFLAAGFFSSAPSVARFVVFFEQPLRGSLFGGLLAAGFPPRFEAASAFAVDAALPSVVFCARALRGQLIVAVYEARTPHVLSLRYVNSRLQSAYHY